MEQHLRNRIASVFSVLPERDASEAVRETLKTLRLGTLTSAPELRWADFTPRGQFQRGGITSMQSLSVRMVTSPNEDPELATLAGEAGFGGVEPGRIIRGGANDRFFWFVPTMDAPQQGMPTRRIKGIVVTEPLLVDLIEHFNPGRGLTGAEKRVMFQLVAGLSLREASQIDRTSVETKRSQVKSACTKMQCSGQIDLVRIMLGQMFHLVGIADSETPDSETPGRFVAHRFAADVGLRIVRLPNGNLVNCFEAGPVGGRPVVLLHGMMFGVMLADIGARLDELGIRLTMPIRPGYLQSFSLASVGAEGALTEQMMTDLALFIRTVMGGPVPVLGQSLGAGLALRFAARNPGLTSSLTLVSTNLTQTMPTDANFAGHLYTGLRDLGRQPGLCRLITWQFRRYYADVELCRGILRGLFSACASDLDVLDGLTGAPPVPPWFSEVYQSSVSGIADDFHFTMTGLPHERMPVSMPVTLIHGENDPITRVDEVARLAEASETARLVTIRNAGHFAIGSQPREVWARIAEGVAAADS